MFPKLPKVQFKANVKATPPLKFLYSNPTSQNVVFGADNIASDPKNCIFLGKITENSPSKSLYNFNAWFDVDFPSIAMIYGRRGTGKSFTLGTIAEGLISAENKIAKLSKQGGCLLIDHLGQFWQMKYPPPKSAKQQHDEIKKWGLEPTGFSNVEVFVPKGTKKYLEDWKTFSISFSDLDIEDWCGLLNVDPFEDRQGQLLSSTFTKVTKQGWNLATVDDNSNIISTSRVEPIKDYDIGDLINCIQNDEEFVDRLRGFSVETRRAATSRLTSINNWGVLSKNGTTISEIFKEGILTVVNLLEAEQSLKTLITGILVKKIFRARAKARTIEEIGRVTGNILSEEKIPPGWILIDEAQNYCPRTGIASSKSWIVKYAKEGRSLGLGLIAATQQPSALDLRLTSQVNVLICHGLQLAHDVAAVKDRILNDMADDIYIDGDKVRQTEKLTAILRNLTTGEALVSATGINRCFFMRIRPRISAHGGQPVQSQ